jgi:hypothetical protein
MWIMCDLSILPRTHLQTLGPSTSTFKTTSLEITSIMVKLRWSLYVRKIKLQTLWQRIWVDNCFIRITTACLRDLKRNVLRKSMVNRKIVKIMFTMHFPLILGLKNWRILNPWFTYVKEDITYWINLVIICDSNLKD